VQSSARRVKVRAMHIAKGKVVGNTVVLEEVHPGKPLVQGASVTVYIDEGWELDRDSTRELLEAMAACDRGEAVDVEEVFAALPPRS
jgi:hypothetical protein